METYEDGKRELSGVRLLVAIDAVRKKQGENVHYCIIDELRV